MERRTRTRSRTVQLIFSSVRFPGPGACRGDVWGGGRHPAAARPPVLDVQRDKDKTVYTIGGSPRGYPEG